MEAIQVACLSKDLASQAQELAKELQLSIDNSAENQLQVTQEGLWLKFDSFKPIQVDFSWDAWRKRREQGKRQDLIKACKVKPEMTVIDTTAGWGRDAALLASFGAHVIMLERNSIIQALLADGIHRQSALDKQRLSLQLIKCEAKQYLAELSKPVDLIYIDPMHPQRQKSALVKKDLQLLQQMIGPDEDAKQLIELALKSPCKRVVVKWPVHNQPLLSPTVSWAGKTIRYDCYIRG